MTTERQLRANRANGKKSTGPRTARGKAVARVNALKHGLSAQKLILPDENAEEFETLRTELYLEHTPQSATERELVELLATHFWRLRRIPEFEAKFLNQQTGSNQATSRFESIIIYPFEDVAGGPDPDRPDLAPVESENTESAEEVIQPKPAHVIKFKNREPLEAPSYAGIEQIDRHQTALLNALIKALHLLFVLQSRAN